MANGNPSSSCLDHVFTNDSSLDCRELKATFHNCLRESFLGEEVSQCKRKRSVGTHITKVSLPKKMYNTDYIISVIDLPAVKKNNV